MAVIKSGNTEELTYELLYAIANTVRATDEVRAATASAIEDINSLGSKTPAAGVTEKLTSTEKNVTLTETIKGAAGEENGTLDGANKTVLTGAGLDTTLTTGIVTGLNVGSNTTNTIKAPAYLGTNGEVGTLKANINLDLATENLTIGNFTSSDTKTKSETGQKFNSDGKWLATNDYSETIAFKTAFTGSAVYVEGMLQSSSIKSLNTNSSISVTRQDGLFNESNSLTLNSKNALNITANSVQGSIDSLNYSRTQASTPEGSVAIKREESFQSNNLGNTVDIIAQQLSFNLKLKNADNLVKDATKAFVDASNANAAAIAAVSATSAEKALADKNAADTAATVETLEGAAKDEAQIIADAAAEYAKDIAAALREKESAAILAETVLSDAEISRIEAHNVYNSIGRDPNIDLQQLANELFKGNDTIAVADIGGNTSLVHGGAGDDRITGHAGSDRLFGDEGNDIINGGKGADQLYGGLGNDKLYGGDDNDILFGDEGDDLLDGGAGNDYLYGGDGNDTLLGGAGNDWLESGEGNDTLDGGAGNDVLKGGAGNDIIKGGAGNDILIGGTGQDTLTGGTGRDLFVVNSGDSDVDANGKTIDTITDFNVNEDTIAFNGFNFSLNNSSVQTLVTGNGAKATYASLLEAANALLTSSEGSVKAVIGYDGSNAYVFVDSDGEVGADTAIKLVGVKTSAAANAIKLVSTDYNFELS